MHTYDTAAQWIRSAKRITAFTGAGISVESGIPTFRGPDGLWSRYDPRVLDIGYFHQEPEECWRVIREIFYDYMGEHARPNAAHRFLAHLEGTGQLQGIITQNIDNLHQEAGSRRVVEYHGTAQTLVCTACGKRSPFTQHDLNDLPPYCPDCGGLLKPDFVFFGEPIPSDAAHQSMEWIETADLLLIIGTTGEIMPASQLPYQATHARVIEINIAPSRYTETLTDLFVQAKATVAADELSRRLKL